jgi:hypothetical protein
VFSRFFSFLNMSIVARETLLTGVLTGTALSLFSLYGFLLS